MSPCSFPSFGDAFPPLLLAPFLFPSLYYCLPRSLRYPSPPSIFSHPRPTPHPRRFFLCAAKVGSRWKGRGQVLTCVAQRGSARTSFRERGGATSRGTEHAERFSIWRGAPYQPRGLRRVRLARAYELRRRKRRPVYVVCAVCEARIGVPGARARVHSERGGFRFVWWGAAHEMFSSSGLAHLRNAFFVPCGVRGGVK